MNQDETSAKGRLIWERLLRQSRNEQPSLTRDQIVRVAMTIADADGVQGVTMRRIATQLGSAAMSLYRHVFSKEDLLDLMLDAVFGEIDLPQQPSGDWWADLRTFAYETRAVFKRHTWVMPLMISRPTLGPHYLRWFEFSLAAIANHGLDIATMTKVSGMVSAYVGATASYEVAEEENTRRIGLSEADKRVLVTPYVQQVIASGQYPNFARFFTEEVDLDPEQGFAFGLDCLLDGIAARLTRGTGE